MSGETRFAAPANGSFPTTHWSVVINAGAGSESLARAALESLCRHYWYPLYSYVRRQGRTHHEAEDCTQEFLARLLATETVARARPERGRFRTFLLTTLRNFLTTEWRRTQAAKRGGAATHLSLDWRDAEQRFAYEPADTGLTPEQAFDFNWAHRLIEGAIATLRVEYERRQQALLFAELAPFIWGPVEGETLAAPAQRLGLSTHAFTVALQRLRQRVGTRLRESVAETVADGAEVDTELRHLIAAVSAQRSAG
jgi:RNA polymerase sigma factor (sigma-70 family)